MREKMATALILTVIILALTELVPESATYAWMLTSYAIQNWLVFYGVEGELAKVVGFVTSPIAIFALIWLACLALLLCIKEGVPAK